MSNSRFRPLNDHILVQPTIVETVSAGGIILAGEKSDKPHTGKVLAIGNGKLRENGSSETMDVEVGDEVLFGEYVGAEIIIDGEDLLVLTDDEVIAILV